MQLPTKIVRLFAVFFMVIMMISCNKSSEDNAAKSNTFEAYKARHNLKSDRFEDYKTTYKDGRKSEIRTMLVYESQYETFKPYTLDKTRITLVVIEWNKNEGVVATEDSTFSNLDNNQMFGGDIESNRRIAPSSAQFNQFAIQNFDQYFNQLTQIDAIPNRNTDYVSFDFVTNKGIFTVQESLKNLENNTSVWSPLFNAGKKQKLAIRK